MGGIFGGGGTISTSDTRINSMRVQQSAYGLCQPLVYGKTRITANMFWYGDFTPVSHVTVENAGGKGGSAKTQNTTYTYRASLMLGLCATEIKKIGLVWVDKEQYVNKEEKGRVLQPIDQLHFELFTGKSNQKWGYLLTKHPDQAMNYPNLGYVCCANYELGSGASLSNHNFEVVSTITLSDTVDDANPADVIEDYIKNRNYGASPDLHIDDLSEFRTYCCAANLLISPAFTEQKPAHEVISDIVEAVNCAVVPSPDGLKIKSYGDTAITGNGVTFTPDLEPVYHLTDDDFLDEDEPIKVTRSRDTDAYNHVQVEYINRYNQYNTETVEAKDQANIEMFGLRTEDAKEQHYFCEPKIAQHAAQLRLQRKLYVRNTYDFQIGWKYCLLEPMDIVTLTDEALGLNRFLVRITRIEEDEYGALNITAEELAVGSRSAVEYDIQTSNGYQGGNESPDNVNAPAIFEPPLDLTKGQNEIWIAVSGGKNWGGCNVWVSLDNTTYERVGTVFGSARYGQITSPMDEGSSNVDIQLNTSTQLFSGTLNDANADATLCKVGDEYLNYQQATLKGIGLYNLSGLLRVRLGDQQKHKSGEQFVRLDRAIFSHEFNSNLIGKQIYLKFTSFNGLQQKEQTLDEVTAYSHLIVGGRTASVKGLSLQTPFTSTSFKVQWQNVIGATNYLVRIIANGKQIREVTTTSTEYVYDINDARADGLQRAYTIRVASLIGSNMSAFSEINISNPVPDALTNIYTSATKNSITVSWVPMNISDFKDYQVWISPTANFDPTKIQAAYTGTERTCTISGLAETTQYYVRVAVRDVWKETKWNYSAQVKQLTSET